ncbi:hypothetical protein AURDEDRAFT_169209 [Auricularia subglabra TFB-10046 SS5]|nr:hypothetical protein AURDEDRAFT_169209 [Auricularia subglabra TFB-10046 SS5]
MSAQVDCAITGHPDPFIFALVHGDQYCLAQATVQDLLEEAAEYHEVNCGCDIRVTGSVWTATVPLPDALRKAPPSVSGALPLGSSLESLYHAPTTEPLSLVIAGEDCGPFGPNEFLRMARKKRFRDFKSGAGTALRRPGSPTVLPSSVPPTYHDLCTTPGAVFVDKSRALRSLLSTLSGARINIIRRPRGFGKTALLSMIDAFFDPRSPRAHFSFAYEEDSRPEPVLLARQQVLVFSLDFAMLPLCDDVDWEECEHDEDVEHDGTGEDYGRNDTGTDDEHNEMDENDGDQVLGEDFMSDGLDQPVARDYMDEGAMKRECRSFLDQAVHAFYDRYRSLLRPLDEVASQPASAATLSDIIRWSREQEYEWCLLVDNYTIPKLSSDPRLERVVAASILSWFSDFALHGPIKYGLLVGNEFPGAADWSGMPAHFRDLTRCPAHFDVIGFTESEVAALGQAMAIDLVSAVKATLPPDRRLDSRLIYSAGDVLVVARRLLEVQHPVEAGIKPVRTIVAPPTANDPPRGQIISRNLRLLFGQAEGTDSDADAPGLTTDGSSDTSSSTPSPPLSASVRREASEESSLSLLIDSKEPQKSGDV